MKMKRGPFERFKRIIVDKDIRPCFYCDEKEILIDIEFFPEHTKIQPIISYLCLCCKAHSSTEVENVKKWKKEAIWHWNSRNYKGRTI